MNTKELTKMVIENKETLARIDSRTQNMATLLSDLKGDLKNNYVSKKEFDPIQRIVYGMVGIILAGALTAILTLIFI